MKIDQPIVVFAGRVSGTAEVDGTGIGILPNGKLVHVPGWRPGPWCDILRLTAEMEGMEAAAQIRDIASRAIQEQAAKVLRENAGIG